MRITASKLSLLAECQYVARPEVVWSEAASGAAAILGTETHALIEAAIAGRESPGTAARRAHALAAVFLDWLDTWNSAAGYRWHAEPAYVLDPVAGVAREVGRNIGRAYPNLQPNEIAGSADLVALHDRGVATIIDVKTGRRENVDAAAVNMQLATLAAAVRHTHHVDTVRVVLAFVGPYGVTTDEHTLDVLDLDAHEWELSRLLERIPTSTPTPGKHCKFCPASGSCPATTGALAQVAPTEAIDPQRRRLPIVTRADAFESMEHARHQYLVLRAAKAAIDQAWTAVQVYADQHDGIVLGNGRAYTKRETTRESIDLESREAVEALRAELGEAFDAAVELSTSKSAIKDAARTIAPKTGEKLVQVERRVLARLREVGAVRTSTSTTYDETARPAALTR